MKKKYQKAVLEALNRTRNIKTENLLEEDIRHLPEIIQKYLRYVGAIGKEKIINFRAEFKGGIRSKSTDEYMKLRSVQYNFTDKPTRLFYIVAKKMGIPAIGIHLYRNAQAIFQIKIAGLIKVVDAKGQEMNQGETVTVFNDMCFLAPATLIDKNISWETIDPLTVNAKFTNEDITIGATLFFNAKGELINFISKDRFETIDGKSYKNFPWITPAAGYREISGFRLASSAKLIYKRPDEDFCYGEFELENIEYNCKELK
ncbi:MAG TPA: hypothetical protein PKN48_01880 [Bacteroidales bacterium]|nr:hypothetical protein [Bacteroidales bacterium]